MLLPNYDVILKIKRNGGENMLHTLLLILLRRARLAAAGLLCGMLFLVFVPAASAAPVKSYHYDYWGNAVPAPDSYQLTASIPLRADGRTMTAAADMFIDKDGKLYVLDSTGIIFVYDANLEYLYSVSEFLDPVGQPVSFNNPGGIFVADNGDIYIADMENKRVVCTDKTGMLLQEFIRPVSNMYPKELDFKPTKVLCDSVGNVYVLCSGSYFGAVVFDREANFQGFYGTSKVQVTADVLWNNFWRGIMTKSQRDKMARTLPVEFSSFDIDDKDFVYTCNAYTANPTQRIRKLNPKGIDIMAADTAFGDLDYTYYNGQTIITRFQDVNVDSRHYINGLDATRGRVFQYDQRGNMIAVFGGIGSQKGSFGKPVAIESRGDSIYVLDGDKRSVFAFSPTKFTVKVREATDLYEQGLYQEVISQWNEILRYDANYELAYVGLGKAYLYDGDFKAAMDCFEKGNARSWYSKAYQEYRKEEVRKHGLWYAGGVIILLILWSFVKPVRRFKNRRFRKGGMR